MFFKKKINEKLEPEKIQGEFLPLYGRLARSFRQHGNPCLSDLAHRIDSHMAEIKRLSGQAFFLKLKRQENAMS